MGCKECSTDKSETIEITATIESKKKKRSPRFTTLPLIQLLDLKFRQQLGYAPSFCEITPKEFYESLNKNPFAENIIKEKYSELENIKYEKDIASFESKPIKVNGKSGCQYYYGTYNFKGQCHGKGIFIIKNGIYYGNFKNDEFCGYGLFITPKGDYYFGEWKNNKLNGQGYLVCDNKIVYRGDFVNGEVYNKDFQKSYSYINVDNINKSMSFGKIKNKGLFKVNLNNSDNCIICDRIKKNSTNYLFKNKMNMSRSYNNIRNKINENANDNNKIKANISYLKNIYNLSLNENSANKNSNEIFYRTMS